MIFFSLVKYRFFYVNFFGLILLKRLYFCINPNIRFSGIKCINLLCCWHNGCIKKFANFQWKMRIFDLLSNFLSSCVRNKISNKTYLVAFHRASRAQFYVFLSFSYYPYLNTIVENSLKKWFFSSFAQIFFGFSLYKNIYSKLLFQQLLFLLLRLIILYFFGFRHNPYLKKAKFQ